MSRQFGSLLALLSFTFFAITPSLVSAAAPTKSISGWVSCSSTADQTAGVAKAFDAAKNSAFTLIVDCPVHLNSGSAIDKAIFIDNGTTVQFSGIGKFFVDNLFHPAFVIANSSNINLMNWIVEWDGSVPVNPNSGGYESSGKFVAASGNTPAANAFNDITLSKWLTAHRSITFDSSQGFSSAFWPGAADVAAVFYITGDSENVLFRYMSLTVPSTVGGDRFMPVAFAMTANWKSGQKVAAASPKTAATMAVPQLLTFSSIKLDGTLMGWVGNTRNTVFEKVTSGRYGDLQDAHGANVGGIGKWFPPPHLFYLSYNASGDPALFNNNLRFSAVVDAGPRVGVARDKGGGDSISGYASSLKLACNACSVDNYESGRADGFLDLLPSSQVIFSNVVATFDSAFLNNIYPAAVRFPSVGYSQITFENVQFRDTADVSIAGPLGNAPSATNQGIVFKNFYVTLGRWAGSNFPLPTIGGSSNNLDINFEMTGQSMGLTHVQQGTSSATLSVTPTTVPPPGLALFNWSSSGASLCSFSGSSTGKVGTSGTRFFEVSASGVHSYILNCQNSADIASASVLVTAR